MAFGDRVQSSPLMTSSGGGTIALPDPVTPGNRALLLWASSDSTSNPGTPSGWQQAGSVQEGGQDRRMIVYDSAGYPQDEQQEATLNAYGTQQVARIVEFEGLGDWIEWGVYSSGFSNHDPVTVELSDEIERVAFVLAGFVTGNANRAFDAGSWDGGYTHGEQDTSGANARMIWGHRTVPDDPSTWPATVSYSDSPPQTSGVIVAYAPSEPAGDVIRRTITREIVTGTLQT